MWFGGTVVSTINNLSKANKVIDGVWQKVVVSKILENEHRKRFVS